MSPSLLYQFGTNAAFLLLSALGLVVILGMMNIINLAHGEFMMLGAYAATAVCTAACRSRSPCWWRRSAVGVFGIVLERLVVRHFYGRELGALVVTWGVSLILAPGHAARCSGRSCRRSPSRAARSESACIRSPSTGWC